MARKSTKIEGAAVWEKLNIKDLPLELQKEIILTGKALASVKSQLETAFNAVAPEGKVARFSTKSLDAKGEGISWAFLDAPKPKATVAAKGGQVNVAALFKKQGGKLVKK